MKKTTKKNHKTTSAVVADDAHQTNAHINGTATNSIGVVSQNVASAVIAVGGDYLSPNQQRLMLDPTQVRQIYPVQSYKYLAIFLLILVGFFLVWAAYARIEQITSGEARVIPSSREQVIQSLEGGIVEKMLVTEGQTVEKNQVLVRIDPTRASASFEEVRKRILILSAQITRLRAETTDTKPNFSPMLRKAIGETVAIEQNLFLAKRQALDEAVAGSRNQLLINQREEEIIAPLVEQGIVSEVELLKIRRLINESKVQITERTNRYHADAAAELSKLESDYKQLQESVSAKKDLLARTEIKAPMPGIVKNIRVYTKGGVVQPGGDILEIIPINDNLLIETRIKPADIAFLVPGQTAFVKFSAYDHMNYGGLYGKLEYISPDTVREDIRRPSATGETEQYYRVMVRTNQANLVKNGKILQIIPGMTATVDIRTGEKTVLNYLLKPLLKVNEAFRER